MRLLNTPSRFAAAIMVMFLVVLLSISVAAQALFADGSNDIRTTDPSTGSAPDNPGQGIAKDPPSGPPGSQFTVSGTGFRGFAPVESITLGGSDILGNRTINTDTNGELGARRPARRHFQRRTRRR